VAADAASASAAGFDRAPICARRRAGPAAEGFLERAGVATWTARDTSSLALVIHDYELAERATVRALLRSWHLSESAMRGGRIIELPVRLAVGTPTIPALNAQTRSAGDLIEIAATAVAVPAEHAASGCADLPSGIDAPLAGFLAIHSGASARPTTCSSRHAMAGIGSGSRRTIARARRSFVCCNH
jgi:hypothetical protein